MVLPAFAGLGITHTRREFDVRVLNGQLAGDKAGEEEVTARTQTGV